MQISVIVPTFRREQILIDSLHAVIRLLKDGDELLLVDQTPDHEPATTRALEELAAAGKLRWLRRERPSQNEAMNIASLLARGEILVFLDDDIIPHPNLLEGHRAALSRPDGPPATCGQVLQPWHEAPLSSVGDFDLRFDPAYDKACEVRFLIGANFAIKREVYLAVGGMDENFTGANYRNDTEIAYRICDATGKRIGFLPDAPLRHLFAGGGNRAFGSKDTWGHIGGSIGDYYFAMKWLPAAACAKHSLRRLVQSSVNRGTLKRPWLVPSMALREVVAFWRAAFRLWSRPHRGILELREYGPMVEPFATAVEAAR